MFTGEIAAPDQIPDHTGPDGVRFGASGISLASACKYCVILNMVVSPDLIYFL